MIKGVITGVGGYLPSKKITNHDLAKVLDTNDQWIVERTGIKIRYLIDAEQGESTAQMAAQAAIKALTYAEISPEEVNGIIVATTTPDHAFPAAATKVQEQIGAKNAFAFDVQAACAGFIYALNLADNFIKTGQAKHILVIGADSMSKVLNWQDRSTCVLFGDGAGAVLLSADNNTERGILTTNIFNDGSAYNILYVDPVLKMQMSGKDVFKHAVSKMSQASLQVMQQNNLTIHGVSWFVPHQANIRILNAVAEKLSLPLEKVIVTVDKHANTSAASIPLALFDSINKIKKNDLVLLAAIGGGLSWGASLLRW